MSGKIRSSHFGIHHVARPIRNIGRRDQTHADEERIEENTHAEREAEDLDKRQRLVNKRHEHGTMMIAAAVTTRAPCEKPTMTDSSTALYFEPGLDFPPDFA